MKIKIDMSMKIIYKTMLMTVVVLSFFSCGNDDEPGIDTPPSNPELMVAEDALFVKIGEDTEDVYKRQVQYLFGRKKLGA